MTASAVSRSLRRLHRDQRGVTAVTVVLTLPVLFAFGALAINSGLWLTIKRQNQSAADAAAISAAYEVMAGNTDVTSNLIPAATEAAGPQNGYSGGALTDGGNTCTGGGSLVCYPYTDSLLSAQFGTGGYDAVAVILRQDQASLFAYAPGASATIATKAVGVVSNLPAPGCLLALGLNPPPNGNANLSDAVDLAGNPTINAPSCTIVSNSKSSHSIHLRGNSTIHAATLITAGDVYTTGGSFTLDLKYPPQTGGNPVSDPYAPPTCTSLCLTHAFLTASMPTTAACPNSYIAPPGGCVIDSRLLPQSGYTLNASSGPMQISGGLSITGGLVDLSPGTYWITDGDLTLLDGTGAKLQCSTCTSGAGVTIILTTAQPSLHTVGAVTLGSNANLNLNAPSSGIFKGLVLIQDSNGLPAGTTIRSPSNAKANATETLTGLMYFPRSAITFQGNPAATGPQCLVLVANNVTLQGTPGFATGGCSSIGLTICRLSRLSPSPSEVDHEPIPSMIPTYSTSRRGRSHLGVDGSVAVEFGLLAPLLVMLAVGIVDLGNFLNYSQALGAATRIGAEYARNQPTCQSGINTLASPPVSSACTTGIQNAMTKSMNYAAGALTFPASFSLTGECDDGTSITLGSSCAAASRPGPNRVFITVSANQSYTPMISWLGLFPTNLAAVTEIRLQ